ncbi:phosphatidylinositolglycan-related [Striga hermonthica]|uniref:Phosphatidylinositolglycan-related n=1 Tax=Striga hermonthica TaxID=68872 RepID=A0A9N7NXL1_STRHE|nr:phosphatidylinositolglycan-related [Striga hermonthica]
MPEAVDVHHIMVARGIAGGYKFCTCALVFAIISSLILLLLQNVTSFCQDLMLDKAVASVLWSFSLAGFFLRQLLGKQVEKESVVILPAFGVQLETTYRSGKTIHHFVPIGKILKPVLNECVTPVTCYWSLSLILRNEDELLLVFKEIYPPVTMLVPVWKALCAAIDDEEYTGFRSDCDSR